MTSRFAYLLPFSILLMAAGLAIPHALFAGLALAVFWAAAMLLSVLTPDAAPILLAGLIGTAIAALVIL